MAGDINRSADVGSGGMVTKLAAAKIAQAAGCMTVITLGTPERPLSVLANGGRVLGVTSLGPTFDEAIANAYQAITEVKFDGIYYRSDIGHRLKKQ